jgi:GNAT superfamily N-acetyltransferase
MTEVVPLYPGWTPDAGPSATADELSPPEGAFLVAYVEDEPVGCGGIKRLSDEAAELKRLYVAPKVRNQSVARALLAALEDAARHAGYQVVRLDTGAEQPAAVQLFRSAGYIEIDDYNANPFASYWFEKVL